MIPLGSCNEKDQTVLPANLAACMSVHIQGTFSNSDGAATLVRLSVSTDEGDSVTLPAAPGGTGSMAVSATFSFRNRSQHTVYLTVLEQTGTPNPYRFSDALFNQTLSCVASQSGALTARSATLATGGSISYTFNF